MGARGLRSILERVLLDSMYHVRAEYEGFQLHSNAG